MFRASITIAALSGPVLATGHYRWNHAYVIMQNNTVIGATYDEDIHNEFSEIRF